MPWTSISIDKHAIDKHGMDKHAMAKLAMYNHCSAKLGNDNKLP
jgi:hypothetical protein